MAKHLPDWHVWRAYDAKTGETLGLRVAQAGHAASDAFKALVIKRKTRVGFDKRATVHRCTKEQAIEVMRALNQDHLGAPN